MTASEHTDHTGDPPQASAWGVASRRVVNEFGRGPGSPSERGCPGRPPQRPKCPRAWGGTPQGPIRPPLLGGAVGPHIRVSNARLNPPDAEGGESGRRAQYLLDILGTTDRLPPLCSIDIMLVKFIFGEYPSFKFLAKDVPDGYYTNYIEGEEIFDYLNANLLPTDIENVFTETDGISCNLIIFYNLRDEIIAGLPCFEPYAGDDDMPF